MCKKQNRRNVENVSYCTVWLRGHKYVTAFLGSFVCKNTILIILNCLIFDVCGL